MITAEETALLMERCRNSRPKKMFENFDKSDAGIMCVLRFLTGTEGPVTAGEISAFMQVSTARVAVLLKKLEEKSFIEKQTDPSDARKTMVVLSETGKEKVREHTEKMTDFFSSVIDRVGKEKIIEFIELSETIRDAIEAEYDTRVSECTAKKERRNDD